MFFPEIKKFILDLLFPISCLNCHKENIWLCNECLAKINLENKLLTKSSPLLQISGTGLDFIVITASYKNSILQKAIKCFKYKSIEALALPLSQLVKKTLQKHPWLLKQNFKIIPIPLHRRRELERGFNQNLVLAKQIWPIRNWRCQSLQNSILDQTLIRFKYTKPQTKLKKTERQINIKGAFAIKDAKQIEKQNILLIDDVLTTGSTLNECAKILKQAGASNVGALVVAED